MQIDVSHIQPDQTLQADVCIIGGGAAGITLAMELKNTRLKVCILEGGGFNFDGQSQNMYDGKTDDPSGVIARDFSESYLISSRLRYFGGTTNHWGGNCPELDAIDFMKRDYIPSSGWPFPKSAIEPYLRRAEKYCELTPITEKMIQYSRLQHTRFLGTDQTELETRIFRASPRTRFGTRYRDEILKSKNIELVLGVTVTRIEVPKGQKTVRRLHVKTLDGKSFFAQAKIIVLASGGIENARILLISNEERPAGLANGSDTVGRYFMEHARLGDNAVGILQKVPKESEIYYLFDADERKKRPFSSDGAAANLGFNQEFQLKHRLPNALFRLEPLSPTSGLIDRNEFKGFSDYLTRNSRAFFNQDSFAPSLASVYMGIELIPNPESRVVLDPTQRDALNQPRAVLKWRATDADKEFALKNLQLFNRELSLLSRGRLKMLFNPKDAWRETGFVCHHIGTTRMSDDPKVGVVDAQCKTHEIENLYIAGSSVFPTGGVANPTYTLVALTIRLADLLKKKIL